MKNDTLNQLALAKAFSTLEKTLDQSVYEGSKYDINLDTRIKLQGTLTIGKSYVQSVAPSIPWQKIALAALSHLNATTQQHVVAMALQGDAFNIPSEEIKESVKAQTAALSKKAEKLVKGKVTSKLQFV